jgi:SAM-dependent methyltransferase
MKRSATGGKRTADRGTAKRRVFDQAYYDRFYRDPATRVDDAPTLRHLGRFVCAYVKYLQVDVERVVDLGCGLGAWRDVVARHFPRASYRGVEISDYLCRQYGWTRGSVVDFRAREPFDLIICQGVLQYLGDRDAARAIRNLSELSAGALYLEVLTREDWERNCDQELTDGDVYLRPVDWYRKRLAKGFVNCGGGVFLSRHIESYAYELEKLG